MADLKEIELPIAADCSWVRGLDANGNPIRISKADLVELMRREMPVATNENNGLFPGGLLLPILLQLEPNQSIEIYGQRLVFMNIENGSHTVLVSFAYWNYLIVSGSLLDQPISISLKSGNLFELKNISGFKISFGYCIVAKTY